MCGFMSLPVFPSNLKMHSRKSVSFTPEATCWAIDCYMSHLNTQDSVRITESYPVSRSYETVFKKKGGGSDTDIPIIPS